MPSSLMINYEINDLLRGLGNLCILKPGIESILHILEINLVLLTFLLFCGYIVDNYSDAHLTALVISLITH